ncbi:hypothetical protein GCM10008015_02470 [Flavobacterium palustre]|uniref:Uncharacterized protein n=1 Tax=Flavobacterium palustre TaxID=1476463 RepID=A0ABQ1HAC6_9FLAO|nr:hypothetical protein [Flavobacterium palustre]GGA65159.1 hypothetical protein GCM10008015_02470 [Flavobacterium palustre]
MDIQLEKLELIKLLAETNDESIIASIKNIFNSRKKDFWNDLTEEQQNIINESLEEYEKGNFSSFDDFIKPHL